MRRGNLRMRRGAADFITALALFWAVALFTSAQHAPAHAVPLPVLAKNLVQSGEAAQPASLGTPAAAGSGIRYASDNRGQTLVLLGIALAGLIAANLAFLRHLRRAYASPRRGGWRRG